MSWMFVWYISMVLIGAAGPTDLHSWKSVSGTSLEARATSFSGGQVTLETPAGKVVTLKAELLIAADQALLKTYFPATPTSAPAAAVPAGKVLGPVEAKGSHYFYYVPKSLKPGRKTALVFFICSYNGSPDRLAFMQEGAEVCGWIIATSVESSNSLTSEQCVDHTRRCLDHVLATQPVDKDRVYYSGNSGGAHVAFTNSVKFKGAGVLALIAGALNGEIQRRQDYYFISGSTDFNRSHSSSSFKEAKSTAAFRFHPSAHNDGPTWLQTEGMIWLQTRWNMRHKTSGPEREDFENSVLTWLENIPKDQDHRAGWWADYLTTTGTTPSVKARLAKLNQELGTKPTTVAYIAGITALEKLAIDVIADGPQYSPDCFEHTSPAIQKAVTKIQEIHSTTPWVKDVLVALKNKTDR